MYLYIVTSNGYQLYTYTDSGAGNLVRCAIILARRAQELGFTTFRRDTSLIGGYWIRPNGDALIASPVELDANGEVK